MKAASSQLISFLSSASAFVYADLYTVVLADGAGTYFYASADQPVNINGTSYAMAACIDDEGVSSEVGVQVDTLELTISADARTLAAGVPLMDFIKGGGWDNAVITAQRAYWANWGLPLQGVLTRFSGRFSEVKDAGATKLTAVVSAWTELFNTSMPFDIYQAQCLNTLFDAKCTLNRDNFKATAAIIGASTQRQLATSVAAAAGVYALGSVVFTSGANAGQRRTITAQDANGNLTLVAPLPSAPNEGDDFNIYQGCDLSQGTCGSKFNNLANFRGQPFIPSPETAL
jgi:uncharacterized phage protein (TIGR02218 family)